MPEPTELNQALLRVSKRAETVDRRTLVTTFVDIGHLFTLLSSRDHQVLYGRRGTGKTHALQYLAESREADGDMVVYIDMRTLGSSGGIYNDPRRSLAERSTRLIQDVLAEVHSAILERATRPESPFDIGVLGPLLDHFADEITRVVVVGTASETSRLGAHAASTNTSRAGASFSSAAIGAQASSESALVMDASRDMESHVEGEQIHRVHFGAVARLLGDVVRQLNQAHVWVLIDEWSALPPELQPYLADMIRRSMLPVTGYTVKIGAIEQRTNFRLQGFRGDYVGIELGADAAADVNLDDYMVFDNDEERAKRFFREFLYKHFLSVASDELKSELTSAAALVNAVFTQYPAFDEFVRATEGVPRDAINILSVAAQKAMNEAISVGHIRTAARLWYQRDKETMVQSNADAFELLNWIIDRVIAHRKARAFLKRTDANIRLIEDLFDARVLHVLKRNISSHDEPGVRYDVYKIDYGCYVDLLTTAKAPDGLLPAAEGDRTYYVDVPPDDYRAIRRAILDFDEFKRQRESDIELLQRPSFGTP